MKVSRATHVFLNEVNSSLQLLAYCKNKPEYLTSAWFVKIVQKWFPLITSRSPQLALGTKNQAVYQENINFLHEVINIFTQLEIIDSGEFKPVQRGIIINTMSVLNLTEYLIKEKQYKFVLTSRFTQDCIENLLRITIYTQFKTDCHCNICKTC